MFKNSSVVSQAWAQEAGDLAKDLSTDVSGLTEKEARERVKKYGSNAFHAKEKANPVALFLKQFLSPLIFLLLGAGILTLALGKIADTIVIFFAVLLNVGLGFYHEYQAETTLDKLKRYIKERTRVVRGGIEQEVDSALVVPGDVIKLAYGSRVPADARLLSANDFSVDEAILTGESLPVIKNLDKVAHGAVVAERTNIAHAGTLVVQGYATALVYATGNYTEIGKIAGIVSKTSRIKTPLQKGVGSLAWFIFSTVVLIVVGILFLGLSRGEPLLPMMILSAAIAVGAVPAALPIALTVILAIGSERIAGKKGVVRKLTAAETLGSASLIMTDKTGTLTLADMQLVGVHETSKVLAGFREGEGEFSPEQKKLLELSLLNVDVSIENPEKDKNEWIFRGRAFEVNLAKAARLHGIPLDTVSSPISHVVLPFNSTNKFSVAEKGGFYVIMGAPDILLNKTKIPKEKYMLIESFIDEKARSGKRLIGLGTVPKKHKNKFKMEDIENIDFLGMFAFYDPIRPEVPAAIKNIEAHGVRLVLVTGDLPGTAVSVAKSLDWEVKEEEVLTGAELQAIKDPELLEIIPKIKIFARVTPEDKLRIGRLYQKRGEIVAMTGDGVNDAPSLKAMDIGISLGSGSDVAKSAADLVLLDDNFETISLAIDEGRRILSNIKKTFVYLMSNSFDEVFVIGGSLLAGIPLPLTALQIIWVNLFTGSLPALAFAFDENMEGPTKDKDNHLIFTTGVKVFIFGVGILSSFLLFLLYYGLIKSGVEVALARSVLFVCFSSYILFIAFSFRSLRQPLFYYDVFSNHKLNWNILIAIVILVVTMTVPALRNIFGLAALPLSWLPFVVFWLIFNIFLVEGAKYFLRFVK